MRILAISDIDEFQWQGGTGQADLVVSCGDIIDQVILEGAEAHNCNSIFAVKGNHDSNAPFPSPIVDLHLETHVHGNFTLGGLNGSWKYKPRGHFIYEQEEVEQFLQSFPPVDVFISHNSPRGIHDRNDEVHHGFGALTSYIERTNPILVLHGHQHVDKETQIGETTVIGVYGHRLMEL